MGLTGDSVTVLEETPSFCFCFVAVTNLHTHTHTHTQWTHTHTHTHTQWSGASPEVSVLFLRNLP